MGVVHVGEELYSKVPSTFRSISFCFIVAEENPRPPALKTALSKLIGLKSHYMHLLSTAGLEKKSRLVVQDKQIFFGASNF